jgi:quercetin 2,3-dioxygenase
MAATMSIRRAAARAVTTTSWLNSRHSFSFGDHYDPANTHHGVLLVNNDDVVAPAAGFETHPHRDMEIVTWVLDGSLAHRDSAGNTGLIYPGLAQRMSAGTGILHSEKNDSVSDPVRFIQMWVQPDVAGIAPDYQQHEIGDDQLAGRLATIASGMAGQDAAITIHNRSAALHGARLRRGDEIELPAAPHLHLFVARGGVNMTAADSAAELAEGDAVRFTGSDGIRLTAQDACEVLVWEMHATLGGENIAT